jgi:hypothetical protein
MSRTDALAAYERLPIPDTTEEHWRFTDLRDFDPTSFASGDTPRHESVTAMLDLDVAGYATVTADGIDISRAPEGVTFEPLTDANERLYSLVGWNEKFAAHNAAMWQHGLLVVVRQLRVARQAEHVAVEVRRRVEVVDRDADVVDARHVKHAARTSGGA